jgi:DNA-binding NarL/FixJ family response regulator
MHSGVRKSPQSWPPSATPESWAAAHLESSVIAGGVACTLRKVRVRVAAENRMLHDVLSGLVAGQPDVECLSSEAPEVLRLEALLKDSPDLLLLASSGSLNEDVALIRKIRVAASSIHIVIFGGVGGEVEFLQYVRAGIRGYLQADASSEDVLAALAAVRTGRAFCPSSLCGLLFRYFESEATSLPSAALRERLGLTRREQQLIPLIAKGLTNKEIANHFSLSEQTIKNHLYRMKHKIGADNRFGIVQTCRTQGFLL